MIEERYTLKYVRELATYTMQVKVLREREGEINDRLRLEFEDHDIATRNIEGQIKKEID